MCGDCNCGALGTYSGDSSCLIQDDCGQDCAGTWGGDLVVDGCGICDGDNTSCGIPAAFSFNQSAIYAFYYFGSVIKFNIK